MIDFGRAGQALHGGAANDRVAPGKSGLPRPCAPCPVRLKTICAAVSHGELAQLAAIQTTLGFAPNQQIFEQHGEARSLYNVVAGVVRAYRVLADGRRQITGFLYPGDFVGFAHDEVYAYGCEAVTSVTLCRYPRGAFNALLERVPRLEAALLRAAVHELSAAQDRMLLLGKKNAKERVASFLLSLAERAEAAGESSNPLWVPMNRYDLGDFLGLAMETTSRTLAGLKREGVIDLLPQRQIEVLDRSALARAAEQR